VIESPQIKPRTSPSHRVNVANFYDLDLGAAKANSLGRPTFLFSNFIAFRLSGRELHLLVGISHVVIKDLNGCRKDLLEDIVISC